MRVMTNSQASNTTGTNAPLFSDKDVFTVIDPRGRDIQVMVMINTGGGLGLVALNSNCHNFKFDNATLKKGIAIGASSCVTLARDNGWETIKFRRIAPASDSDTSIDKVLQGREEQPITANRFRGGRCHWRNVE